MEEKRGFLMNTQKQELLIKWLQLLFYARVASLCLSVLEYVPALSRIADGVGRVISIGIIWCLFQLGPVIGTYAKSGFIRAVAFCLGALVTVINMAYLLMMGQALETGIWAQIYLLVYFALSVVAIWFEYSAHRLAAGENSRLGNAWSFLFVCNLIFSVLGTGASFVLALPEVARNVDTEIITIVGTLTQLGNKVFSALCLWFLYQTLRTVKTENP